MASLMSILKRAGFRGQGLQMAYAIAMAESGGRARAHNGNRGTGDNSYGLFQINMLGGMGPERRRRYGLSSNESLFDPLVNARVAYRMSNGGRNWGPWSTYHNGAYRQYYGGTGASVTGGGTNYLGSPVTPHLSSDDLAGQYGLSSRLINSSRELKSLFKKAVSGQWSAARFQASLRNTRWWRTQSSTLRKYVTLKHEDPATFSQKWKQAQYKVNSLAVAVGLGSQIGRHGSSSRLLREAIYNSLALGWSDARIKDWLGARTTTHGGVMWGEAGEAFDKLHELAYLNGMRYHDWYKNEARKIASGRTTLEEAESSVRRQAAAKYGAFAEQIKAGQNVMDLAAPYIKSVANILELPETDIDLFNRHVAKAMTSRVKTGQQAGSQYPIWQFEVDLRSDPLWKKTNNARESMFQVAHSVAKDFGMVW